MGFWSHILFHDWLGPPTGPRDHMPGPLPMTEVDHPWHYIDPPTPPGWMDKPSFGMFHRETGRFIDSHGKGGTYCPRTQNLMNSEGVVMDLSAFYLLPDRRRRVEYFNDKRDLD